MAHALHGSSCAHDSMQVTGKLSSFAEPGLPSSSQTWSPEFHERRQRHILSDEIAQEPVPVTEKSANG